MNGRSRRVVPSMYALPGGIDKISSNQFSQSSSTNFARVFLCIFIVFVAFFWIRGNVPTAFDESMYTFSCLPAKFYLLFSLKVVASLAFFFGAKQQKFEITFRTLKLTFMFSFISA